MMGHTADRLGRMADRLGGNADTVSRRWKGVADRVGDHGDKWGDQYKNIGRLEEEKLDEFADSHDGIGEPGGQKKKKKKDDEEKKDGKEKKEEKKEEPADAKKIVGGHPGSKNSPGIQKAAMPSGPKTIGTPAAFIQDNRNYKTGSVFSWPQGQPAQAQEPRSKLEKTAYDRPMNST